MALEFAPGKTRIGWIGTGVMGTSMCGHLLAAGYQATVYNRTPRSSSLWSQGGVGGELAAGGRRGVGGRFYDRRLSAGRPGCDSGE